MKINKFYHILNDLFSKSGKNPTNVLCRFDMSEGFFVTAALIVDCKNLILCGKEDLKDINPKDPEFWGIDDASDLLHAVAALCNGGSYGESGDGEVILHRNGKPGVILTAMKHDSDTIWFESGDDVTIKEEVIKHRMRFLKLITHTFYHDLFAEGFTEDDIRRYYGADDFDITQMERTVELNPDDYVNHDILSKYIDMLMRHAQAPYSDN